MIQPALTDVFENNGTCDVIRLVFDFLTLHDNFLTTFIELVHVGELLLFFGKETAGLPESLLKANLDRCVRIPMLENLRSLNLSNSVAIAVYETLRQWNFEGFEESGKFGIS